jgi:hypothetical protein
MSSVNDFVRQIIKLDVTPPGTSISYGGLVGASSPRQHAMEDLKRKTLEFAQENQKANPNKERIKELSKEIEGHLLGLNSLQAIDDRHLDKLRDELDKLVR